MAERHYHPMVPFLFWNGRFSQPNWCLPLIDNRKKKVDIDE